MARLNLFKRVHKAESTIDVLKRHFRFKRKQSKRY